MKKLFLLLLVLCLGLSGCDWANTPEEPALKSPSLPALKPPDTEPLPTSYNPWPFDLSRLTYPVLAENGSAEASVAGPAGAVKAKLGLGFECYDPIWTDVDGDGQTELIYWCNGPTSGIFTVGICVYGLEQGWPVLEASASFWLEKHSSAVSLENDELGPAFCLNDESGEPLRLPLTIQHGSVVLNGGVLPEGIVSYVDSSEYGRSFAELKKRVADSVILDHWACVIWKQSVTAVLDSDPEGQQIEQICAAVTDNGVTVTGWVCYQRQYGSGALYCRQDGITPAPPATDLKALEGLTLAQLAARLGLCHFSLSLSPHFPCWFTEDGKLLILRMNGVSERAELHDLTAGEPLYSSSAEKQVVVDLTSDRTRLFRADAWEAFLQNTAAGKADEILIISDYGEGLNEASLSFDGSVYIITEDGVNYRCFRYLITDREDNPPASATFDRAVHYLLSDDPEMTFQRWMGHLLSSAMVPDFPAVLGLFSVFE